MDLRWAWRVLVTFPIFCVWIVCFYVLWIFDKKTRETRTNRTLERIGEFL